MTVDTLCKSLLEDQWHHTTTPNELLPFLASYNLIPQLLSNLIIDRAIAPIQCTPEETEQACEAYYQSLQLTSEEQREYWRSRYALTQEHIEQLATRPLKIETFKREMWLHKLESYFLKRKHQLDRVIYSLLRTRDRDLAAELFFRIQEQEAPFAELANAYSEGPEAQTGGLMGPVEFGTLAPKLAELLYTLPEKQVHAPVPFGEWYAIVRVEKRFPAQLNEAMVQRLLQENFEAWFQEQLNHLAPHDQVWMGLCGNG